ncbi:hypothetical protein [Arthrobacter globiformis]|uniref:hypothetical protein n=1 Tax=Arthrobacter globiformis TaxID=1665 RepID=UPI002792E937|nr:hypothetical protein [Arthrobacter globiformis]MDQ0620440.1 hypothetical protein [Arthrobacter globiformis]
MNHSDDGTSETFSSPVRGGERPDLRSMHIREDVAQAGRCGNVHLATGRICILPQRHHGSCDFVGPEDANGVTR